MGKLFSMFSMKEVKTKKDKAELLGHAKRVVLFNWTCETCHTINSIHDFKCGLCGEDK